MSNIPSIEEQAELLKSIHMRMLEQSQSANKCGELTVIPIGFATAIAFDILVNQKKEWEKEAVEAFKSQCHVNVDGHCKYWKLDEPEEAMSKFFPQSVLDNVVAHLSSKDQADQGGEL